MPVLWEQYTRSLMLGLRKDPCYVSLRTEADFKDFPNEDEKDTCTSFQRLTTGIVYPAPPSVQQVWKLIPGTAARCLYVIALSDFVKFLVLSTNFELLPR